eukprot:2122661-Rhodomonas_salina.8
MSGDCAFSSLISGVRSQERFCLNAVNFQVLAQDPKVSAGGGVCSAVCVFQRVLWKLLGVFQLVLWKLLAYFNVWCGSFW